ncbi:MAG: beta-lactamase family protein [Crocinitomicaceae bacterium]|nr:beta-lactamase family protein [Crocinitomicaceae bacterium]
MKLAELIVITVLPFLSFAQNPNPSATLDAQIQNEMITHHFPGVSTIIVKNGEIVWVESYGYADIANAIEVEDTTVFLLASVSKLFTGTAAMQLSESGLIEIDTDINQYLPWYVDIPNFNNDSITARQLMTHTSSIKDNWGTMGTYYGYPDPTLSLANCMENYFPFGGSDYSASGNFYGVSPGTEYNYSNMASALNGYLVEVSSGVPFDDYCDSEIFNPLCMKNTAWHYSDFDPNQVATPYSYQGGSYTPYDQYGFADYPDGQLRSTVLDLGNFMIAVLNGGTFEGNTILNPSSVNEMLSFQIPSLNSAQGLNWYQTLLYHSSGQEEMLWGHSGGEKGVNTHLFIDAQNDIGLCVLTNGEGDGLYICDHLYDHALNMTVNNSIAPDCNTTAGINALVEQKEKHLVRIIDFMGRETAFKPNIPLIYIYSDGTRERVINLEE